MASNRGPNAVLTVKASAYKPKVIGTATAQNSHSFTDDATKQIGEEAAGGDGTSSGNAIPASSDTTPKPPQSKPPSRTSSYYEEAVRSVLKPGQRALFFGKGAMGVVLKPTYLAR
jgi:hypothetical protein